ncbi:MAG: 2-dehydropantoate 2-reductase [Oscillospiraceae bacterium]|nr:2-dehydropantoate 2-reductase [Oscillospiraceae bacterium]
MKIGIIGSGAIGCYFGGYLSRNNEVCFFCRRQKPADNINRNGVTVFEPDGTKNVFRENVRACLSGDCTEKMDLLIIVVKGMDTASAVEANLGVIGPETTVMTMQNGGGHANVISRYVPMEQIVIATTRNNVSNLGNGVVRHNADGTTFIGGNKDSSVLSRIAQAFEEAGFDPKISDNIQRIIWSKLFVNLSINAFTAITKARIGSLSSNESSWFFAEKLLCEAVDVAEAEGQHFTYRDVLNMVHDQCEQSAAGFSSMSQDVMNCRKTEIDYINGYVVSRAAAHNVPTPYNQFVVNLVHAIENTYQAQEKEMIRYAADDVIIRQGEMSDCIFKVVHGSVSLYHHYETADEYLFGVYAKDRFFGEYSCFSGHSNLCSVVANEDTVVMKIPKAELHNYIALNPLNAETMLQGLSQQTAMMLKHFELVQDESAGPEQ